MKGRSRYVAVATVLACGPVACGAQPAPEPTASPSPPACTPDTGTVTWDEPSSAPSLLHVVARYRDKARTTWRDLLDRPFTPAVTGDDTDRSWIPPLARSLGELHNLSLGEDSSPRDELEQLRTMLEGSTTTGWVLGYSGTTLVEADFRVTCGAGDTTPVTGTLTTWNSIDAGFLSCADASRHERATYPDARKHCPTD